MRVYVHLHLPELELAETHEREYRTHRVHALLRHVGGDSPNSESGVIAGFDYRATATRRAGPLPGCLPVSNPAPHLN